MLHVSRLKKGLSTTHPLRTEELRAIKVWLAERERMKPDSMDAVIDYLLSVEQESAAVRLIMAGKRNGLTPEQIEERLR